MVSALLFGALVDEDNRRIAGVGSDGVDELVDELAMKQSTVMAEKYEEREVAPCSKIGKQSGLRVERNHAATSCRAAVLLMRWARSAVPFMPR